MRASSLHLTLSVQVLLYQRFPSQSSWWKSNPFFMKACLAQVATSWARMAPKGLQETM